MPTSAPTPRRTPVRLATPLTVLAVAALLSACGGGGDAPGPTASPEALRSTAIVSELVVYVSPTGDDAWSGALPAGNLPGLDGPKRTLAGAQATVRARLAAMQAGTLARQAIRVAIQPGTYPVTTPIVFDGRDSGVSGYPVVYAATEPGRATLSGGVQLPLRTDSGGVMTFGLPSGTSPNWALAQQLYANGERAVLARQPNEGTSWFVTRAVPTADEVAPDVGRAAFQPTDDALAWMNALSSSDRTRAVLDVYQSWTTGRHRFATSSPAGAVKVTPKALWPFLAFGANQRYFVENVRAALDAPGEWLGEGTTVTYRRRPDDAASVTAVMPVVDELVRIKGDVANNAWVQYFQMKGLRFAYARHQTSSSGATDHQAAVNVPAAVNVDGARNIVLDGNTFEHLGGHGLWLRQNVRNAVVSNNTFDDLGAGGIRVGLTTQSPTAANGTGANQLTGNTITHTGRTWPGAVGIWVGQSFDNVISRNLVAYTTYSGISAGWTWGFASTDSGRNTIANNLLFNIGLGQLADMGGIYTVGVSPGTVIRDNLIREVRGYTGYGGSGSGGAWGIFGDEGTSQVTVSGNVIVGTDHGGWRLNFGRGNTLSNNVFAWGDTAEVGLHLGDTTATSLSLSGNLLVPLVRQPFEGVATAPDTANTGTLVSNAYLKGLAPDLSRCAPGCTASAAVLTADATPAGVTLTGAPTALMDVVASTLANAGPIDSPWRSQPAVAARPAPEKAPPLPLEIDIAGTAPGDRPTGLTYSAPGFPSALQVVDWAGAPGGRCLQFADTASFANSWDPHAFATLNYTEGTATARFTMLHDANAKFAHEWRDNASPYRIGPTFRITGRGVEMNGALAMALTPGAWHTFTVTAPLGDAAGTWSLTVTDAAGTSRTLSNLAVGTAGWNRVDWLGLISLANVTTTACVASLTASDVL